MQTVREFIEDLLNSGSVSEEMLVIVQSKDDEAICALPLEDLIDSDADCLDLFVSDDTPDVSSDSDDAIIVVVED